MDHFDWRMALYRPSGIFCISIEKLIVPNSLHFKWQFSRSLPFHSDNLAGTNVYGFYSNDSRAPQAFSIAFNNLLNTSLSMLFMSGDGSVYLHTTYGSIAVPTNSSFNTILTKTFATLGQSNAGLPTNFIVNFRRKCCSWLL
jgi:hypothetical protein